MPDRPTTTNRRTILKVGGTLALAGIITPAATVAQTDLPIEIEIFAEEEYVVLRNVGDEEVDVTGYSINFDAEGGNDQEEELAGDVVIGPGEEVTVGTGEQTTIDPDVELAEPYEGYVINDANPDTVVLLDPDDNVVASSEGELQDPDDGDDGDDGDGGDGDDGDGDDGDDADEGDTDEEQDGESDSEPEAEDDDDTDTDKDKTDADGDGVDATDDADDNCPKKS